MKEYKYTIDGKTYEVTMGYIADNIASVTVNGEDFKVEMEPEKEPEKPKVVRPVAAPAAAPASSQGSKAVNSQNAVKAPLPGTIIEVKVNVGDEVKAGDVVVVLEAEKGGKVTATCVQPGQSVMEDEALVVIE